MLRISTCCPPPRRIYSSRNMQSKNGAKHTRRVWKTKMDNKLSLIRRNRAPSNRQASITTLLAERRWAGHCGSREGIMNTTTRGATIVESKTLEGPREKTKVIVAYRWDSMPHKKRWSVCEQSILAQAFQYTADQNISPRSLAPALLA